MRRKFEVVADVPESIHSARVVDALYSIMAYLPYASNVSVKVVFQPRSGKNAGANNNIRNKHSDRRPKEQRRASRSPRRDKADSAAIKSEHGEDQNGD